MAVDPRLVTVAIEQLPNVIALLKSAFTKTAPDAPQPTSEEVLAAYQAALGSSLAKDADWLSNH